MFSRLEVGVCAREAAGLPPTVPAVALTWLEPPSVCCSSFNLCHFVPASDRAGEFTTVRFLGPADRALKDTMNWRIPAAQGRAVVLRIEPLRVSPLPGFRPSRNTARPAAPAVITKAALPVAGDRGP